MVDEKICNYCKKTFYKTIYMTRTNSSNSSWNKKKYCSYKCCEDNNKKEFRYELKKTEHDTKVKLLNGIIKGEIVFVKGRGYFEDIRKEDVCFELQMMSKSPLINKSLKWDVNDKHILVVCLPDKIIQLFDGIKFFHNNKLYSF